MTTRLTILVLLLCSAASMAQTTDATTQPATQGAEPAMTRAELSRAVDASIRKGVKYLLSRQHTDGSWSANQASDPEGGGTALAALALLSCGESHQSPPLDRAIKFLKRAQPEKIWHATYSIGLRAAVYASLPEAMRKSELPSDMRWLQTMINKTGDRAGMYDYGFIRGLGGDYSNSQYGVLGVWYGATTGIEVRQEYWKQVEAGWLRGQLEDGGWSYMPDRPNSYASMTAAAIATLYITNDYLHAKDTQDLSKTQKNIPLEKGLAWLGENFAVDHNSGRADLRRRNNPNRDLLDLLGEDLFHLHYMLFGYERVGEASGLTRFGTHKWYDEGAEHLIRTQEYDGSWKGSDWPEVNTAYALLFLSRGRAPVVVQKLQFGQRWNNRPRDANAFTRFMRRASERHVNWQIVSLDDSPEELRESPLLYAASDVAIDITAEQKAKLKNYIDQGGLLVCAQDGTEDEFARSVVALAGELYPAYAFRDLSSQHPAYSFNFPANVVTEPIRALGNGVRDLIVLYPRGDMSWKWQSSSGGFLPKSTPYATLANLWLYATDRANPRYKGDDIWLENNPAVQTTRTARVGRIRHEGNWDPEPGGWTRLGSFLHNFDQCQLNMAIVPASPTSRPSTQQAADLSSFQLLHLTDTRSVKLSAAMKASLKAYLDKDGMLLMDAAGGSPEVGGSFDVLLRELYPNVTITPLPLEHPIYHATTFGGQDIERVTYRRSSEQQPVRIPRLRGAMVGKKLVAIISYEDLSGGLVGYPTAGLTGYSPNSALDLMRNIVLWRSSALR